MDGRWDTEDDIETPATAKYSALFAERKTPSLASVLFIYTNRNERQSELYSAAKYGTLAKPFHIMSLLQSLTVRPADQLVWSHTKMFEAAADEEDVYLTAQSNSVSSSSRSSYLSAVDCGFCPFCRSDRLDEKRLVDGIIIITCLDCGCSSVPSSESYAIDNSSSSIQHLNQRSACDTDQLTASSVLSFVF
jgi:hypothetical protein